MKSAMRRALMIGFVVSVASVAVAQTPAKLTVGNRTWEGNIVGFNNDMITFRQADMLGQVSYPADAIKELEFPIGLDDKMLEEMMRVRQYDQMAKTITDALKPFEEYKELPSNMAKYHGALLEIHYKTGNFSEAIRYASMLVSDARNPALQRKAVVYQALSLLGLGELEKAQVIFDAQGWNADLGDDAPAEDLYLTAQFLMAKKEYEQALVALAKIVAFNSQNLEWMRPAELLCAEAYFELAKAEENPDFYDSAYAVIGEIIEVYKDTDEADKAQLLKTRVDSLRGARPNPGDADVFGR